jgi:hypothetical protein
MKLFPITVHTDTLTDPSPPAPAIAVTRRSLLQGTGVLMGTLVAGSPLALLAPSTAWALELKTLSQAEGQALLRMAQVLFPHQKMPEAVYALLVKDLDAGAMGDQGAIAFLKDGVASLNHLAGGSFIAASAQRKAQAVKSMEGQAFFSKVRGQCVLSLYDNDMAYAALGYPGSAWEKGGYLTRGFQDLKWLPNPPAEASPKPYLG